MATYVRTYSYYYYCNIGFVQVDKTCQHRNQLVIQGGKGDSGVRMMTHAIVVRPVTIDQ